MIFSLMISLFAIPSYSLDMTEDISSPNPSTEITESVQSPTVYEYPTPTQEQVNELSDNDWEVIHEMMQNGNLSFEHAFQILRVDKIVDKLEQYGQEITTVNNCITVLPAPDGVNYLSDEETEYIIDVFTQDYENNIEEKDNIISREKAILEIQDEMKRNPHKGIYSIYLGAGHTLTIKTNNGNIRVNNENSLESTDNTMHQKAIAAGESQLYEEASDPYDIQYLIPVHQLLFLTHRIMRSPQFGVKQSTRLCYQLLLQ